jgi:hypothetical protein
MDVIILGNAGGLGTNWLLSAEGLGRLGNLLAWLARQHTAFDAYFVVPPESPALAEPLAALASGLLPAIPGLGHLVLDGEGTTTDVLQTVAKYGLPSVIVNIGPSRSHDALVLRALAASRSGHAENMTLTVWLAPADDGDDLERARGFTRCGVSPDAVAPPLLPIPREGSDQTPARAPIPREMLAGSMMCDLFANTLTVTGDGAVIACPRFNGVARIDRLLDEAPEALIVRRGAAFNGLMAGPICLSCSVRGRFLWPERKSPEEDSLFSYGMNLGPGILDVSAQRS